MAQASEMRRNRPLSPHLTIYRPQLTSLLSIAHRATGIALSVGALVLVWWLVALAAGEDSYAAVTGILGSWLGRLLLLGWLWALIYHFLNGVRHLAWDAGWGLDLPMVYHSGWVVLYGSIALTVFTLLLIAVA